MTTEKTEQTEIASTNVKLHSAFLQINSTAIHTQDQNIDNEQIQLASITPAYVHFLQGGP